MPTPTPAPWDPPATPPSGDPYADVPHTGDGDDADVYDPDRADGILPRHLAPTDDERAVLGAALLSRAALDELVLLIPGPSVFYRPAHEYVWEAIVAVHGRGQPVDPVTVAGELHRRGHLAGVGGPVALVDLQTACPSPATASVYAGAVLDAAEFRAVRAAADRTRAMVAAPGVGTPDEIVDAAVRDLEAARSLRTRTSNAHALGDLAAQLRETLENPPPEAEGLTWGWPDLEKHLLLPMMPGQLIVVGARPAVGKSTFIVNVCEHVAFNLGRGVVVITLENSGEEVVERITSHQARVPLSRIARRTTTYEDRAMIAARADRFEDADFTVYDDPDASLASIDLAIRRHRPALIVLDYLQLAQLPGRSDRREALEAFSRGLKVLGKRHGLPFMVAAQLSRASESRPDGKPQLSDLRETGAIEQDADTVILLWRPDMKDPDVRPGEVGVIVAKQRRGGTGTEWLANRLHHASLSSLG